MRTLKFFNFIIVFFFALANCSTLTFAAENDSKILEQAISKTKSIIEIPESYSDFTHSIKSSGFNTDEINLLTLNWSEQAPNYGCINVSINENGDLCNYTKYTNVNNHSGLAEINKDEALITAENFLSKVLPTSINSIKLVNSNSLTALDNNYTFTYKKYVNDIPSNLFSADIGIDKYTGEVTFFNSSDSNTKNIEYPSSNNVLSYSNAKNNYIDKIGVNLKYYSFYDYKKNNLKVFPAYSIETNKAIDANSGDIITLTNRPMLYENQKLDNSDNTFTKEENDAINNVSGLITKEKAENILKSYSNILNSKFKITDTYLNKNSLTGEYVWQIIFDDAYGEINAKSGEVLSFSSYSNNDNNLKTLSEDEVKNISEQFLKEISTDKFSQTKYTSCNNTTEVSSLSFVRQVNNIDFVNNYLNVSVNKNTGKVIQFNNLWYDDISFPDINNVINLQTAFDKISQSQNFGLQYVLTDKDNINLIYNFTKLNEEYLLDPISGDRLDLTGEKYENITPPKYTDISDHWCEDIITTLLNNGYYIYGDKFNPDNKITQINFLKYLYSPTQNYYTNDEFYNMLITNNIIKENEKAPNDFITNKDISKLIVRYLKYEKVALHSEIFINPFKDNIDDNYKGYASVCYALNIIKGDSNGNFNAETTVTNAEASKIIYNLLMNSNS